MPRAHGPLKGFWHMSPMDRSDARPLEDLEAVLREEQDRVRRFSDAAFDDEIRDSARVVAEFLARHFPGKFMVNAYITIGGASVEFWCRCPSGIYQIVVDHHGIYPGLSKTVIESCLEFWKDDVK